MATIKSYTDIEQSRKLAKILPLESADMVIWGRDLDAVAATDAQKFISGLKDRKMNYIPCWSLASLLDIIGHYTLQTVSDTKRVIIVSENGKPISSYSYPQPVDACYEMILKLHELNLL
jgi:hypothetical protein